MGHGRGGMEVELQGFMWGWVGVSSAQALSQGIIIKWEVGTYPSSRTAL